MKTRKEHEKIKIGYMPLAHEVYWKFFPERKKPTIAFAGRLREYISQFGTVVETGKLIDSAASSHEARLRFQQEDVDVIVLATVTYSTPDDVILDLKRFPRPAIVWNTQATPTIPKDMGFNQWMLEHGVTGVPGITNLLERETIPYFLISGHYSSDSVKQSFLTRLKAISVARRIWGSRIGMFGHLYPGMIDFGYDPTMMYSKFGVSTVPILESTVLKAFKEVSEKDVRSLEKELRGKYSAVHEFKGREFTNSVRLALAMKRVVDEKNLDAATVYCQSMWQNAEIGVVSCIGNSLLMQQGVFCSCEGDVPSALAGMILETLSGRGIFTEIWCNDFDRDEFMMGHSGQMNLALFEGNERAARLSRHPWWDGCHGRGICLQVKMPPGEATMLSISSTKEGNWRMITAKCEITGRDPVPLGAPNFFVKMEKPITEFIDGWGKTGAAHHLAMTHGDCTPHIRALATLLGVEHVCV